MSTHPSAEPEQAGSKGATITAAGTAALGGFLFGYDSSIINGAVGAIDDAFGVSPWLLGFSVSAALIGAAIGAWFAGRLADRFGRVRLMVIAAVVFCISGIASGLVGSIWALTAWRFVGGAAIGAASVIAPAYIVEISPARLRGRLGSLQQLAITIGIFVALLVDALLARVAGGAGEELWLGMEAWRWMFISVVVPAVVYGIGALWLPESPRFLVRQGRIDEARTVLRRFVGGDTEDRITAIQNSLESDHPFRLGDLRGALLGLKPIVWAGILLAVFQQFCGINVIFYYSSELWQSVGFGERFSLTITVITSVTNVLVTFIAIALVDRIGRKPLLLIGAAGMTVALGTLAVIFGTAPTEMVNGEPQPNLGPIAGPIALAAANVFVIFFGSSWAAVVWVMLGEMFNNFIRASALALCSAVLWIANWIVTTTFPILSSISLGMTYGIYALMTLLSFIFVWRMVRETKGRELEEM